MAEFIISETHGRVGVVILNRPQALNALNTAMIVEIGAAVAAHDADDGVGAIVITGSDRAFAAGADIKEMADPAFASTYFAKHAGAIEKISARKPIIAAVAGFALGGGCELALLADIVIAADNAKFGQPEITLGIIPGMGGTQRLPRAVGKAKALEMILTGRTIDAAEAERAGLVAAVVPPAELMATALAVAAKIASYSLPAVIAAKAAVTQSAARPLAEGVVLEQRLFHALFSGDDQKEGMAAFIAKRSPTFRNR
ncbi:MAG: enoyl-CoA hydratase-related protein [Bauldia sp.]